MKEETFTGMLRDAFGSNRAEVILEALKEEASTAIRLNPLKAKTEP